MRRIYDMTSNSLQLWMDKNDTYIKLKGEIEQFSAWEIEDLIDTLVELRPQRSKEEASE